MAQLIWLTPAGLINKIPEEEYYEFNLDAYYTEGGDITFTAIAGKLPGGLQLFKSGLIQGIPIIERISASAPEFTFTFTVRATSSRGKISDRSFTIVINSIALPQIIPRNASLGTVFDGQYLDLQLTAIDPHPLTPLTWKLTSGKLPNGVKLSSDGKITGYVLPSYVENPNVKLGWGMTSWDYINWDQSTLTAQTTSYQFSVEVYDGSRRDNTTYTMLVQAKGVYTAYNTHILANETHILVSTDNQHNPFISTPPQSLPVQRQNTNFAFKVDGIDLDGDILQYNLIIGDADTFEETPFNSTNFQNSGYDIPVGLDIDPDSGWVTGFLPSQSEDVKTYTFRVECFKRDEPASRSEPVTFTLTILGDPGNIITWTTPSNLGEIVNGEISMLHIDAVSARGKQLHYFIHNRYEVPANTRPEDTVVVYTPDNSSKLPQGLKLLPNGLIVGRASFEYFSLDGGATSTDKGKTTYDTTYTFTVTAADKQYIETTFDNETTNFYDNGNPSTFDVMGEWQASVISHKTFTVTVKNINPAPYENLYLRAFLPKIKRDMFTDLMNNQEYFPDELLYRPEDPWFGKASQIKVLFASGLKASSLETYANAVGTSHYNKFVDFKDVKTAVALDENFKPIYEVVYLEVVDNLTVKGKSIAKALDRSREVKGIYTNAPYQIVYPNSFDNMKENVVYFTTYTNRGAIPDWMLDQQEDGKILGFTRGFVLAYTVPGASKLIAYRLRHSGFSFNDLDFLADRYQLDNYLSTNYDIAKEAFIPSLETTFDRMTPVDGYYHFAGTVDLAVMTPFEEINGRTLNYIAIHGGINGQITLRDGMTLVFAKQENFTRPAEIVSVKDNYDNANFDSVGFNASYVQGEYVAINDGWNIEQSLYDAIPYAEGVYAGIPPYYDNVPDGYYDPTYYDDAKYAGTAIVPGYIAHLMFPGVLNDRAGIWRVNITSDNLVILTPVIRLDENGDQVNSINPNDYVQVSDDSNIYGGCKIYYDPVIKPGNTVPEYSVLTNKLMTLHQSTRFDGGKTRFFNNVDTYAPPETGDRYLKFPKLNIYR